MRKLLGFVLGTLASGCFHAPQLVAVTENPESLCRFALEVAEGGASTFPPLSFSPDGRWLVAASDPGAAEGRPVVDGYVWLYDLEKAQRSRLRLHGVAPGGFYPSRWSPRGDRLAAVTADHVELVEPDGTLLAQYPGPLGLELTTVAFTQDGGSLAVAGKGGVVYFVDLETRERIDGDVFKSNVVDIEPEGAGFVVFHRSGERLHRSFVKPGSPPERRADLVVKKEGSVHVFHPQDALAYDPQLGLRLVVQSQEYLLVPGLRGGGGELLVHGEGFRLSATRRRLAFARVSCGQAACAGSLRVMQCEHLPGAR